MSGYGRAKIWRERQYRNDVDRGAPVTRQLLAGGGQFWIANRDKIVARRRVFVEGNLAQISPVRLLLQRAPDL